MHFSTLISTGNECDLGVGEIGAELVDHNQIDGFILFLETIRRPESIIRFAEKAAAAGKPIIAYKLGRSEIGQELSVSHTGAMVGMDAAVDAFFRQIGIYRVDLFDTMFELPPLLVSKPLASVTRRKYTAAVLTTTGGGGAMVVDRLGAAGIEVVGASDQVRNNLRTKGINLTPARLIDVTLAGANYETMYAVITELLMSEDIGILVVAIGSSAHLFPELAVHPIIDAVAAVGGVGAPVIAFPVPEAQVAIKLLASKGIATARTPESCAEAVTLMLKANSDRSMPAISSDPQVIRSLKEAGAGVLSEAAAMEIMALLGIPSPKTVHLSIDDPTISTDDLTFPVVAKLVSADLPHKTEAGAVRLGVADAQTLVEAIAEMKTSAKAFAPNAQIASVLVQETVSGVGEVLLGFTRDPNVGPVVTVGMGGVMAEIYKDFVVETAPVDVRTAHKMIEAVRGFAPARGYRGAPRGDLAALAETISAFSRLAAYPSVQEAEINPVIIGHEGDGVFAVDALIRLGGNHD